MPFITILVAIFGELKALSPVVLAVASGLGMILTKTLGWGISEIFQALALVFSGVSVAKLRSAVVELSALAQVIQGPASGKGTGQPTGIGTTPAPGAGTAPASVPDAGQPAGTGTTPAAKVE